jgi:hypothetical protein
MLEFLGRFVVETLFQGLLNIIEGIGHEIARAVVPFVTAGRVKVAPLRDGSAVIRRWHGIHRLSDGTPVMGETLAAGIGLLIIAGVLMGLIIAIKSY